MTNSTTNLEEAVAGTILSFFEERAGGELELHDGRRFWFTIERLEFPNHASALPKVGAPVHVDLALVRGVPGVRRALVQSTTKIDAEPAVHLDGFAGSALVFREKTRTLEHVACRAPLAPCTPVTVEVSTEGSYRRRGSGESARVVGPREGAIDQALVSELKRMLDQRWRAYCKSEYSDELEGAELADVELRGLLRALEHAGYGVTLPRHPILTRLVRELEAPRSLFEASRIDWPALEKRLGLPVGPTFRALVTSSVRLQAGAPASAYEGLGLSLDALRDGVVAMDLGNVRPTPCTPFASFDASTFSFVVREDASTDQLAVVRSESDFVQVVANDLATFLGMVSEGQLVLERTGAPELDATELELAGHLREIAGVDGSHDTPDQAALEAAYAELRGAYAASKARSA